MTIKYLWTLARSLHMSNEMVHEVVQEITGKTSIRKLTRKELGQVTRALEYALRHDYTIDPEQKRKIYKIGYLLKWNCKQIRGFIKHVVGKNDINILQREEASKVIEGMKAILKRKNKCTETILS